MKGGGKIQESTGILMASTGVYRNANYTGCLVFDTVVFDSYQFAIPL